MTVKPGTAIMLWLFILSATCISARQPQTDHSFEMEIKWGYIFPNHGSINTENRWSPVLYGTKNPPESLFPIGSDEGRELGSDTGWTYGSIIGRSVLTIPMLRGDTGLTEDNNLTINTSFTLNPVADMNLAMKAVLTPLPFFNLFASASLGAGWTVGDDINGLAVIREDSGDPEMESFNGFVSRSSFGAEFLFNLAAVLPEYNPWLNILFSASGSVLYQNYSTAGDNEAWAYGIADDYSFNGCEFISEWFLGYMIPEVPLGIIGMAIDTTTPLGSLADKSPSEEDGWGSEFTEINANLVTIWPIRKDQSIQFVVMWNNNIKYEGNTAYFQDFRNRISTGQSYWTLKGIQISYKKKF